MPGMASASDQIGAPHSAQNQRVMALPLSPSSSNFFSGPETVNVARGASALTEKAEQVDFWQCVQWQSATVGLSSSSVKCVLPHRQLPERFVMRFPPQP